jgi:hypothetical protein
MASFPSFPSVPSSVTNPSGDAITPPLPSRQDKERDNEGGRSAGAKDDPSSAPESGQPSGGREPNPESSRDEDPDDELA